jgi:hypothetical protein
MSGRRNALRVATHRYNSCVHVCRTKAGRGPLKLLLFRPTSLRLVRLAKEAGRLPVKLFMSRSLQAPDERWEQGLVSN